VTENESPDTDTKSREFIIVRRAAGEESGAHKGGAWKIAYADFVTAMMAFFLVMWLINSANEATKARVASYFNPIKMTDPTPSGRGLITNEQSKRAEDKKDKVSAAASVTKVEESISEIEPSSYTDERVSAEERMMAEPFKALDTLSAEGSGKPSGRTVELQSQYSGDPFAPRVWETLRNGVYDDEVSNDKPVEAPRLDRKRSNNGAALKEEQDSNIARETTELKEAENQTASSNGAGEQKTHTERTGLNAPTEREFAAADELKQKISGLQKRFGGLRELQFEVRITEEGLLIVLEDSKAVSMFQVGSAEPNPDLIAFIGEIGRLLDHQQGSLIIRGHTDGRRYQSGRYDNWQLSTARAHMASYMLMRGGLSENRILKIEGYGAARLLRPDEPLAEVNRRVEFLLVPTS
jgi:chemotaxis protein MotB